MVRGVERKKRMWSLRSTRRLSVCVLSVALTAVLAACGSDLLQILRGAPRAPTGLGAELVSSSVVELVWKDQSLDEERFEVQRKHADAWETAGSAGANETSFRDVGLLPEREYSYRVRAVHRDGESAWTDHLAVRTLPRFYAYLADRERGLVMVNVSSAEAPAATAQWSEAACARDVAISGGVAFLACDVAGLQLVDVREPDEPRALAALDTPGYAWGVAVQGDYAYVADHFCGMTVVDVSNPGKPEKIACRETAEYAVDIAVSGDSAYVADYGDGLAVIGISDPRAPGTPVYCDVRGYAEAVTVRGDYAYVAVSSGGGTDEPGLAVIDVTDPTAPVPAGAGLQPNAGGVSAYGVHVEDGTAYLACGEAGLAVIDVEDPGAPGAAVFVDTPGRAMDVTVRDGLAYVADSAVGVCIVDVTDPAAPRGCGSCQARGYAQRIAIDSDQP